MQVRARALLGTWMTFALGACAIPRASHENQDPINATCPRSGKPLAADSLTEYRGLTVGFCNPHCRDDFAGAIEKRPADRAFFDRIIDDAPGR